MLIQVLSQHLQGYIFQALRSKKGETMGGGTANLFRRWQFSNLKVSYLGTWKLKYLTVCKAIESVHFFISWCTSGIWGYQPKKLNWFHFRMDHDRRILDILNMSCSRRPWFTTRGHSSGMWKSIVISIKGYPHPLVSMPTIQHQNTYCKFLLFYQYVQFHSWHFMTICPPITPWLNKLVDQTCAATQHASCQQQQQDWTSGRTRCIMTFYNPNRPEPSKIPDWPRTCVFKSFEKNPNISSKGTPLKFAMEPGNGPLAKEFRFEITILQATS